MSTQLQWTKAEEVVVKKVLSKLYKKYLNQGRTNTTIYGISNEDLRAQTQLELLAVMKKNLENTGELPDEAVKVQGTYYSMLDFIRKEDRWWHQQTKPWVMMNQTYDLADVKALLKKYLNQRPVDNSLFIEAYEKQNINNKQLLSKVILTPEECTESQKKQSYKPLNMILNHMLFKDKDQAYKPEKVRL